MAVSGDHERLGMGSRPAHPACDAVATAGRGSSDPPVTVPAGSPLGSLLGAAFDAAVAQVPLLSPELGDAVLQNLCGLVALACGASDEGRLSGQDSLRAARLEAAKRYIEQHLAEPDLTPTSTAAAWAYRFATCTCCSSRPASALRNMSCSGGCCGAAPLWPARPGPADRWPTWPLAGASTASPRSTAHSSASSDCRRRRCAPQCQGVTPTNPGPGDPAFLHAMRCRIALAETTGAPSAVK